MFTRNDKLMADCHDTWVAGASFRRRRRRYKDFTYGRQWADTLRTPEGRVLSEAEAFEQNGRTPVTNNLIRQTIKSIIGRLRQKMEQDAGNRIPTTRCLEVDYRTFEEFLISGCCVQYVNRISGKSGYEVNNISPERFFFQRCLRHDASDCRLMGVLHDVPLMDVVNTFARDSSEMSEIFGIYRNAVGRIGGLVDEAVDIDFYAPELPDHVRLIEVWRKTAGEYAWIHDLSNGEYGVVAKENLTSQYADKEHYEVRTIMADYWVQTFLTPTGAVLGSVVLPDVVRLPILVELYPMIDGEVHSLVEDIIDQQKYINRLVSLLDDIIASSAKGVLLFPTEQLPDGFTWRDVRRLWSNPNGVLPYKVTDGKTEPRQINTGGTSSGASDMLRLQLQLFDEISGTSGALRGRTGTARGADMLKTEIESADTCILDLIGSFVGFLKRRSQLIPNS